MGIRNCWNEYLTLSSEEMGRVKKEQIKREKFDSKSDNKDAYRKINSKSHNIKKTSSNMFDLDNVYSVLRKVLPVNDVIKDNIEKLLPAVIDTVSLSMPKYLGYFLPTFASKVVPRPLSGVAYNVASETVVPYIVDKVIPQAMDHLLSDETRVNMAIDRSLRESKSSS